MEERVIGKLKIDQRWTWFLRQRDLEGWTERLQLAFEVLVVAECDLDSIRARDDDAKVARVKDEPRREVADARKDRDQIGCLVQRARVDLLTWFDRAPVEVYYDDTSVLAERLTKDRSVVRDQVEC